MPEEHDPSWFVTYWPYVAAAVVLLAVANGTPYALEIVHRTMQTVFEMTINIPLRELHRYGPALVGWEGASLPHICARITYHGDEEFWRRNVDECRRIFDGKEEAFLRTARPILYVLVLSGSVWLGRSLWNDHWNAVYRSRNRVDREMVETHRALQTIVRQVGKALQQRR